MLRLNRLTDYAILVLGIGAPAWRRYAHGTACRLDRAEPANRGEGRKAVAICRSSGNATWRHRRIWLLDRPEDISLVHIVEAVEGPIAVNGCVDGTQDLCAVSNCCFMSNHWNKVNGLCGARCRLSALPI